MEDDCCRQPVDEFRFESFLNLFQHCLSGSNLSAETYRGLVRELCSGIGGHDKYNMAAVRFPSFVIRQYGIVHDLQQDIEYIRMRFFYFVKQ